MTDFSLSNGQSVHLIGDPHLGKKFEVGVPPHRRGEREISQAVQFSDELNVDADIIVMVGDLFNDPYVPDAAIVNAARAVLGAAEGNPQTLYVMMAGNHDKPRNLSLVGAWHAFREMTQDRHPNLVVLDRPAVYQGIAFFPWEWDRAAQDQVADVANADGVEHAIGHWDLAVFNGKDEHLAPVAALRTAFGNIGLWSGHYHVAGQYGEVFCTGSMQPYAHGEGALYVSVTRAEALAQDLMDKCVQVVLQPGEDLPDIDCLSLTHKRERVEKEETVVSVDDFNFHRIVLERIKDLDPQVKGYIIERMALSEQQYGDSTKAV